MDQASEDYGFTFVWKIHNYSYCVQKVGEYLCSPDFSVNNCEWNVNLFPRGTEETPDCIGIALYKSASEIPMKMHLVLSISTDAGPLKETGILKYSFEACSTVTGTEVESLKVPVIHIRENIMYCNKDTVTVKCKIVQVDDVPLKCKKICSAYTINDVQKFTYNWNVNTVSDKREKKIDTKEWNLFNSFFTISPLKGYSDEETFEIVIKLAMAYQLHFSSCTLSLLDAEKVLQSIRNEHWFEKSETEQIRIDAALHESFSIVPVYQVLMHKRVK
ncbi:hypothetical protein JTE90_016304 [Oedothorax gibbosus]|uniref:MATH domain-containing protein n=1 Tax=Oedothorax gibbosus TaxID=931172 RepID=A0AAV6U8K3_9ARAC|nr:hypothetical protein JTE90_016304 [Oedothorax gibbosus]